MNLRKISFFFIKPENGAYGIEKVLARVGVGGQLYPSVYCDPYISFLKKL